MVEYSFEGNVPNSQILEFYSKNRVDCFVMPSQYEGLPVSIMEAEGAGIPIVATDVGGIKEMIDGNGVLLSANPSAENMADAILSVVKKSGEESKQMRDRSLEIWNNKFDASRNAQKFVKHLKEKYAGKIKNLILVTEGYPYTDNEKSFLETELKELAKSFNITIVARLTGELNQDKLSNAQNNIGYLTGSSNKESIKFICYEEKWNTFYSLAYIIKYFFDLGISKEKGEIIKSNAKIGIRLWESIKYYGKALTFRKWIIKNHLLFENDFTDTMFYTYWNLQPTLGLCFAKKKHPDIKLITRAHGYDYQDEQWEKSNRKPFMKTIDRNVDEIVFVSETGMEYHLAKHGSENIEKCLVSYLGSRPTPKRVNGIGTHENETVDQKKNILIVSCASLIPLKRVKMIIDSLKVLSTRLEGERIKWIHFGDGPLMNELKDYAHQNLGIGNGDGQAPY